MRVSTLLLVLAACSEGEPKFPMTFRVRARHLHESVAIPAGSFWGPKFTCASESEFGEQTEPAFRIDKRPISCKEYELCAAERSCSANLGRGVIGENVARSAWDLAEFRCVQAL